MCGARTVTGTQIGTWKPAVMLLVLAVLVVAVMGATNTKPAGCTCEDMVCSCCADVPVGRSEHQGCVQFRFQPGTPSARVQVTLDNETEGPQLQIGLDRAPDDFCLNTPIPILMFCVHIFDFQVQNGRVQACVDLEAKVGGIPVLQLHFDCFRVGTSGVENVKPGTVPATGGQSPPFAGPTTSRPTVVVSEQENADVYDPVTEAKG